MRNHWIAAALVMVACSGVRAEDTSKIVNEKKAEGFVPQFEGNSLNGWTAPENPDSWTFMPDGSLRGKGNVSHLYSPDEYTDVEFFAEVKTEPNSNSGMYVRAPKKEKGFPKYYEAQVNQTHKDPRKTGSLYSLSDIHEPLAKDNEWFTQQISVKGNHITIKVNGKTVVEYDDPENRATKGHTALQQHDPGSVVYYRNVMVKDLSDKKAE